MIDNLLYPLKLVVAWIMVNFHTLLSDGLGMNPASGVTWALSIVGLVIVMRILLIPLFVKQIKASRGMQLLAPEMQVIQKKYKGKTDPASREAMSRETMDLYKKHGTNPFASCLPILAQSPIFFALFRVLYRIPDVATGDYEKQSIGPLTADVADQFVRSRLFGAGLSEWFLDSQNMNVKVVSAVLIVLMSITTFTTQKQLTQKNMPASALQGPMAQQQKILLYVLPLVFAISGVNFPIGVLVYWTTTNLWSMGQQFYVIRRNPTPGSEAERLLKERRARKAAAKGIVLEEDKPVVDDRPRGQREQPKRKARVKPTTPSGASAPESGPVDDVATEAGPSEAAGRRTPGATGGQRPGGKPAGGASAQRPKGTSSSKTSGTQASKNGAASTRPAGDGSGGAGTSGTSAPRRPTGDATPGGPRKPRTPRTPKN
jgi:YidC/Oxa1 family membrane protein insertase